MSDHIDQKGDRLLADGAIKPDPALAVVYHVDGDNGHYTVVISEHVQMCSCPARKHCSHLNACLRWARAEDTAPDKHAEYQAAREARRERERQALNELARPA